ncbi:MAG: 23S rRNA (uracil(1939)-C(5))-methyltransferase RlmD [Aeromicrobium sp.]|nr:23S rRNA (uracil(1939)-C(5))-methyltransferase RlmD [Burkholderiales bacterium]
MSDNTQSLDVVTPQTKAPAAPPPHVAPTATIESLDHEGRGVAHVDGKVVFIEAALPFETVTYRPSRKKKQFETAALVQITKPSPQRVTPGCKFFEICGGCALQHADMRLQVASKQRGLEDNLRRIGKVTPERILPPIYGAPWAYRHRARLSAHYVAKKGGVLVGFRERKSSFVADMRSCEVLAGGIGRLISPLRDLMSSLDAKDRMPQIELAVGERVTALVIRNLDAVSASDETKLMAFADQYRESHRIQWWLQPKGPETAYPFYPLDAPALTYLLPEFDLEILFRPTEFTQVNHRVNRLMVERAIDLLDPRPGDLVADLFCGLGNFTLPIARRGATVVGVEGSTSLTERGADNARRNGLEANTSFFVADLYTDQESAMNRVPRVTKMMIDPPRDGAMEVCKLLTVLQRPELKRLVYVSCSPSTLARDADVLVNENGFRLTAAGVVNMFPHTAHVESIAVFER